MDSKKQQIADLLFDYFKSKRSWRYLTFMGKWFDNHSVKDPTQWSSKSINKAKMGRQSLVNTIVEHAKRTHIKHASSVEKVNPQKFLKVIEDAMGWRNLTKAEKDQSEFFMLFDEHYGKVTHMLIKSLLLKHHQKVRGFTRVNKIPAVNWKNQLLDLTDINVQMSIYDSIMKDCQDPLALRLALSPQRWWLYTNKSFEEFMTKLRYYYRRLLDVKRSKLKLYNLKIPKKIHRNVKIAIGYTRNLLERNIFLKVPNQFVIGSKLHLDMLYNPVFEMEVAKIESRQLIKALKYGVICNPWEVFETILANFGQFKQLKYYYPHLFNVDDVIAKYKLEVVIDKNG